MRVVCMLGIVFFILASLFVANGADGKIWVIIEGKITSIDPVEEQIVVGGKTIQVTEDTKIVKEQEEIEFSDLEVDMMVRVRGLIKQGVLVAYHICVKSDCIKVEGEIASIDPVEKQIVVSDLTIQITADTVIKTRTKILTFEDLEVGQTVKACGEMDNDILVAKKVCVKYEGR